ncbi:MAG: HAMP domain-containing sensor histidine kinase [Eubacteriales bacterium]|nr:HAMP domain-containing sensor histidine kinase [Eubacteriales bacterium]
MTPLSVLTVVLAICCIILIVCQYCQKQRQQRLYDRIQAFLLHPTVPKYSVQDDSFALLENAAADLENKILTEHANMVAQSKQNVDFVADISHQLKTPLAALKLYCEMDAAVFPNAHTDKQLVLIEHMEELIYSLLRLENLKADAYAMSFQMHPLHLLVADVWNGLYALYPTKCFTLEGQAQLRCDEAWIKEAIVNILKNSCEHTTENGKISVLLEQTEAAVHITIRDNGGGVPEDELPKLFQRFFHSSRNTSKNSAGIGLAITKEIITKHHGIITAANDAHGLCMYINLPIIDGMQSYEIVS